MGSTIYMYGCVSEWEHYPLQACAVLDPLKYTPKTCFPHPLQEQGIIHEGSNEDIAFGGKHLTFTHERGMSHSPS